MFAAEVKKRHHKLILSPGDPSRTLKLRQFRARIAVERDDDGKVVRLPMLVVYDTCNQFIRTIPNIPTDKLNIEEIDTKSEDHIYDEACHPCMARPLARKEPKKMPAVDKMLDDLYRMPKDTDFEGHALREYDQAMRDLGQDVFDDDVEPTGFIPTIQE